MSQDIDLKNNVGLPLGIKPSDSHLCNLISILIKMQSLSEKVPENSIKVLDLLCSKMVLDLSPLSYENENINGVREVLKDYEIGRLSNELDESRELLKASNKLAEECRSLSNLSVTETNLDLDLVSSSDIDQECDDVQVDGSLKDILGVLYKPNLNEIIKSDKFYKQKKPKISY